MLLNGTEQRDAIHIAVAPAWSTLNSEPGVELLRTQSDSQHPAQGKRFKTLLGSHRVKFFAWRCCTIKRVFLEQMMGPTDVAYRLAVSAKGIRGTPSA